MTLQRTDRTFEPLLAWTLAGTAALCQVGYPLVDGTSRDRLTVATVLITFAAVTVHAIHRFGAGQAAGLLGTILAVAAGAELLGAHAGIPFGDYSYGGGLGPTAVGVPLTVPLAWTMMAYPALLVARRLTERHGPVVTALVGGWALASWDLFLDPMMVAAGHWRWDDPTPALPGIPAVPLTNYAGWLLVSVGLMALLDRQFGPDLDRSPGRPEPAPDLLPGLLYLWTYTAQVLANLAFFERPAVALLGGAAMGAVAIPYARTLRSR